MIIYYSVLQDQLVRGRFYNLRRIWSSSKMGMCLCDAQLFPANRTFQAGIPRGLRSFTKIGKCKQLTAPVTPVELDPHANCPRVTAEGQKTDLASPQRWLQFMLGLQIRVRVAWYYLQAERERERERRRQLKTMIISVSAPGIWILWSKLAESH